MLLAPPLLWNSGAAARKAAVATAAAASPPAEGGGKANGGAVAGGISRTVQLGAMILVWYLLNIYFNIFNKLVCTGIPPEAPVRRRRVAALRVHVNQRVPRDETQSNLPFRDAPVRLPTQRKVSNLRARRERDGGGGDDVDAHATIIRHGEEKHHSLVQEPVPRVACHHGRTRNERPRGGELAVCEVELDEPIADGGRGRARPRVPARLAPFSLLRRRRRRR